MTLVVAFKGRDGITIAADSRENLGAIGSDYANKLIRFGKNCVVGMSGSADFGLEVVRSAKERLGESDDTPFHGIRIADTICDTTRSKIHELGQNCPPGDVRYRPEFLVVGYEGDKVESAAIHHLDAQNNFQPMDQSTYGAKIGCWVIAAVLERHVPLHRLSSYPVVVLDKLAIWYLRETGFLSPYVAPPYKIKHVFPDDIRDIPSGDAEKDAIEMQTKIEELIFQLFPAS
ncbi:MAG: hypothetical protein NT125_06835 [Candidatus Bipolaricaulota bacterium]|nr:hypothetical protein [Candidatus Bipolaricaulota bacterium]